jgi:hypothetical protein
MNKSLMLSVLVSLIFLILSISPVSAYIFHTKIQDDATLNHYANASSFYYPGLCNVNLSLYVSAGNLGSYSFSNSWYSPDFNIVKLSNPVYTSNISCLFQGYGINNTNTSMGFYEARTKTTTTAATTKTWIDAYYDCQPDENEYVIINNTGTMDSTNLNYPYGYRYNANTCFAQSPSQCTNDLTSDLGSLMSYIDNGYYTNCGSDLNLDRNISYKSSSCGSITSDADMNYWILVPFNSMYAGKVIINITQRLGTGIPSGLQYSNQYYLWDKTLNTTENLGTSFPYNEYKNLIPNHDYWLFIGTRYFIDNLNCGSGYLEVYHNHTKYSISIWAYQPDLNCTEWSSCSSGIQTRDCYDLNGKITPFVDTQSCISPIPPAAYTVNLGFDEVNTAAMIGVLGSWYCSQSSAPFCDRYSENSIKERLYPKYWYMSNTQVCDTLSGRCAFLEDFLDMSDSFKYGLTGYSLKMWYIPRKTFLPNYNLSGDNNVHCNETTIGRIPMVNRYDMTTGFWIARNITAFTKYVKLQYRAVQCDEPEIQMTGGFGCLLQCNLFGNCPAYGICSNSSNEANGKDYYTWDGCYEKPKSSIFIAFKDLTSGGDVLRYAREVNATNWEEGYEEDILNNLSINKTYEIVIGVPSLYGVDDKNSYCTYIDDMNILFRDEEIPCSSGCLAKDDPDNEGGYTYRNSINFTNGCQIAYIHDSPYCVPNGTYGNETILTRAEGHDDWCDFTVTPYVLHHYDDNIYDWTYSADAQICKDEKARQEFEAATKGYQISLYAPPLLLQDFFKLFGYDSENWALLWFFFSTFMLINYVAIGLGILSIEWTKNPKQETVHWELAIAVIMIIIFGAVFAGFYPLEIGIPAIIVCVLLLANKFGGGLIGKGG